jgi:hypothetical protein
VKDIAKFIGFVQFYSKYINHFKLQFTSLHKLPINNEYTYPVALIWSNAAQHALDDLKGAILANPCLMCFNHTHLVVLRTDFASKDFGYIVCQLGTETAPEQAMAAYQAGNDFAFMTTDSSAVLRLVVFGGRSCRGNETPLHSHLGEGFAGDCWAINKNWHMLFGICFVWVTDSYAVCFILLYNGNNPPIIWL